MGCGVCFFSLRIGLGSGFVVLSFGGAVGGFSVGRLCFFFGGFLFLGCSGFLLSFLYTSLSFVGV